MILRTENRIVLKLLLPFILLCIMCGCEKNNPEIIALIKDKQNNKQVEKKQFNAYLKFKRIGDVGQKKRKGLLEQYLYREALAMGISSQDLLDADLLEAELNEFRKEMLISRYFEKYLKEKVTDQNVLNYYNTHITDYETLKAHVSHILIRLNKNMSEMERQAKLTTAQQVYGYVTAGKDFGQIAKEFSEDRISAKKDGDLGWISKGAIDLNFSKKVFAMKPGEITEPFETIFGFHVVKLMEKITTVRKPFENVRGNIRHQLRAKAKKAELDRLKGSVTVELKE